MKRVLHGFGDFAFRPRNRSLTVAALKALRSRDRKGAFAGSALMRRGALVATLVLGSIAMLPTRAAEDTIADLEHTSDHDLEVVFAGPRQLADPEDDTAAEGDFSDYLAVQW